MNAADLAKQLGDVHTSLNIVWTLITGFMVMFMQAGFALVETGLTRAKNVAHTMGMNILVYAIAILGFWSIGFALQMGGVGSLSTFGQDPTLGHEAVVEIAGKSFGLFGLKGFFLSPEVFTPGVAALFLFQLVFMDTGATIPTGAGAERWKFTSFVLFSFAAATVIYPVFANWVWGGGWLSALGVNFGLGHGHVDFAGSSVVHMTGGVMAYVVASVLGPRQGKFAPDGTAKAIPGHSVAARRAGDVHPGVRLVRLQPGLDALGQRHANRHHRGQHDARFGRGRCVCVRVHEGQLRFTRRDHDLQRDARGARRDHRAVRVRHRAFGRPHRADRGGPRHPVGALRRAEAQGGRPGGGRVGAWRVRRVGHPGAGAPRRRAIRGGLERRSRAACGACSTEIRGSFLRAASGSSPT